MPPAFVTRATNSTIDFFVGPSFQEARGSSVPAPSHCDSDILSSHSSIQTDGLLTEHNCMSNGILPRNDRGGPGECGIFKLANVFYRFRKQRRNRQRSRHPGRATRPAASIQLASYFAISDELSRRS